MNIITIVGARPQFIKAAVVSTAIKNAADKGTDIKEQLLHTGQHYDYNMSDLMFRQLGIEPPAWNLECGITAKPMDMAVEQILKQQMPDMVIVYGDTDSTLAGAQAAHRLNIPIIHIEAGLRSFQPAMKEEYNRIETDRISSLLFCPTTRAVNNLKEENITEGVYLMGDVMYDAALQFTPAAERHTDILQQLKLKNKNYCIATIHRAETADNIHKLRNIFTAFKHIKYNIIFPLHPHTARTIASSAELQTLLQECENVIITEPVGYLEMLVLEKNAKLILTDSGGVQKEAYFQHTPCITLRDETEWTETVTAGWNQLAGTDTDRILKAVDTAAEGMPIYEYGDGHCAKMIVDTIVRTFIAK